MLEVTEKTTIPHAKLFTRTKFRDSGVDVWVAAHPMTRDQARQTYPYRPESKYSESRFGGNTLYDDVCLLLSGRASKCIMCQAPTQNKYLENRICPDCDGRSEYNGKNPHLPIR